MARNVLSHEIQLGEINDIIRITGTQRQPTLVEAQNYILENSNTLSNFIGLKIAAVNGDEYQPTEEARTLTLYTYGFGQGCPVCNNMQNLDLDHCPVCLKKWDE